MMSGNTAVPSGEQLANISSLINEAAPIEDENLDAGEADDELGDIELENGEARDQEDEEVEDEDSDDSSDESEDDSEQEESEDDETSEDEGGEIEMLADLAEYLEVDEGDLYQIQIPMGDGLDPISLSALKDNYMETERLRGQIDTDRQNLDNTVREVRQQFESAAAIPELQEGIMVHATTMRAIVQANEAFDWDALEASDPTQAMLQRQKLERAYAQAKHSYDEAMSDYQDRQKEVMENLRKYESAKTAEVIPEWRDPKVYQKDADAIGIMLVKEYGFSEKELENITDHRLSKLVRDLMLLKSKAAEVTPGKIKVQRKNNGKRALPGKQNQQKQVAGKKALNKTISAAKKSNDLRVKAAGVSALINGG